MAFPHEILYLIFKQLSKEQLLECRKVCRSWKTPAQRLILNDTVVINVDRFIKLLDDTPSDYKHAIRKITFKENKESLKTSAIKQIVLNLPNIETIQVNNNLLPFKNLARLSPIIAKECPRMKQVVVNEFEKYMTHHEYYTLLLSFKDIQTKVDLGEDLYTQGFGGPIKYLANFSKLQSINTCKSSTFNSLKSLLLLFERLTQFAELKCEIKGTATHINTLDTSLVNRLAQLKALHLKDYTRSPETVQFITRYFSGLKNLKIVNYLAGNWTNTLNDAYCNTLLEYTCNVPNYKIILKQLPKSALSLCLPPIFRKVFDKNSSSNTFNLYMFNDTSDFDMDMSLADSRFHINIQPQTVTVYCASAVTLDVETFLDACPTLYNVNSFKVTDVELLSQSKALFYVLDRAPTLTRLIARSTFQFPSNGNTYPRITHLQLDNAKWAVIRAFIELFPNLKYLTINCYFDTRLCLHTHDLQRLDLEVSRARKNSFFVIKIQLLKHDRQYVYKVNPDSLQAQEITTDIDYANVMIRLWDLQCLNLQYSDIESKIILS